MTTTSSNFTIWPPYEVFYIQALLFNCRAALASIDRLSHLLEEIANERESKPVETSTSDELLHNLQNTVIHGAGLSRYFWPTRSGHDGRAAFLRRTLAVAEDSPLKNRDLRNQIEHFDEKLDAYLRDGIVGYVLPGYVGPLPETSVPTHLFRAYYIDVGVFEMLGKRYEVEPIAKEIIRLHDRLQSFDVNGGRLRE